MNTSCHRSRTLKLVVATSFPADPNRPHGGVEAVSVHLVRALARRDGLDVHVVTTDRSVQERSVRLWEAATIHRLPWAGGTVLTHATRAGRRDVAAYVDALEPDLVHAHDFYGMMVTKMAVPRVFTVHGFIHADTRVSGQRFARIRSRIWRHFETSAWADQPHIISISPYVRERLRGVARGVIHDIDNPIGREFFEVDRREEPGTVFSAALLCPRKNTVGLVEAFGRLRQQGVVGRLRLAGSPVSETYHEKIRRCIARYGLEDCVSLLGPVSSDEVRSELARASAFALVSLEENAPMGIAEAMAVGVPVVASNRCGMPYMVRDGETGFLVRPECPGEIADRLANILRDSSLRRRMSERAREIARDRFHPDRVAARTHEVYRRAVEAGRQGT